MKYGAISRVKVTCVIVMDVIHYLKYPTIQKLCMVERACITVLIYGFSPSYGW